MNPTECCTTDLVQVNDDLTECCLIEAATDAQDDRDQELVAAGPPHWDGSEPYVDYRSRMAEFEAAYERVHGIAYDPCVC